MFGGKDKKTEVPVSNSVKPETTARETAAEEKVSDSVVVADDTVANTVDETITAEKAVANDETTVSNQPQVRQKAVNANPDSQITELNREKYLKKTSFAKRSSAGKRQYQYRLLVYFSKLKRVICWIITIQCWTHLWNCISSLTAVR